MSGSAAQLSPTPSVTINALLFTYAHGPHALGVRCGFPETTRLAPEYRTEKKRFGIRVSTFEPIIPLNQL
jgi:hypothetical protein